MSVMDYDQMQLVAFRLGAEEYAVPVQNVEGIIKLADPTKVPGSPAFIRGVMNLRGKVISILDLRARFAMGSRENEDDSRVLVVQHDGKNVGILVDEVSEVMTVETSAIQPPPPEVVATKNRAIEGLCKVDDRLIIILDLGAVLEDSVDPDAVTPPPDAVARAKSEQVEEVSEEALEAEPVGAEA